MVAIVSATDDGTDDAVRARMAYPLVEAKLQSLAPARGTVERARLVDALLDPAGPPVVALLAGPGYGKTTLLAQWVAREPRPVAWLTLDDLDNDPAILVAYLEAAFGRIRRPDPAVVLAEAGAGVRFSHRAVPGLLAQLHRGRGPAVLVLDDAHRITDRDSLDVLAAILDHLPPGLRVAIAGRHEPELPLARLRASRSILDVGEAGLALDEAETAALAAGAGCDLTADEVRALALRTEGWPAATYLAVLAHGRDGDAAGAIGDISGGDRFIAAYLGSEVEAGLDADDVDLLARTAVLESVTPAAATMLTGIDGAALRLHAIARRNLLVHEVGAAAASFRYHNLLREFLLAELERREPGATAAQHGRASTWYAAEGSLERAVEHALASGDRLGAAQLATTAALPTMHGGRVVTVERWLGAFDTSLYEAYPPLALMAAWVHLLRGDAASADRMADLAHRGPEEGGAGDPSLSFDCQVAMLDAVLCRKGPRAALADAGLAAELATPGDPLAASALWLRGSLEAVAGDLRAAATTLEAAADAAGDPAAVGAACAKLATIRMRDGDWDGAAVLAARAEAILREVHFDTLLPALLVAAVRARVAIQRGDERSAREHLVRAQLLRPLATHVAPWVSVDALLELARAYLAVSDPAGAQQVLREAEHVVRRRPGLGSLVGELVELRRRTTGAAAVLAGSSTLTAAELRVLPLLPTYLSFQDIADRLGISRNTVKTHAMSIYGKLWASSRGEAVERAVELGLLEPYPGLGRGRGAGATALEDREAG